MSKNTTDVTDVPVKKSLVKKLIAPIQNHPKIATAVALGIALVAGAEFLGTEEHDGNGNPLDVPVIDDSEPTEN